ncbi:alkaline phosphatase D family protein [Pseudoalteromonas sp. OOF1S-7]|uniref:alkaline phosphatase D family protein n=1 Tax=Pseudoalteromonas sp. OOF1S-7 TaxID=2917757 RepID=UPI001EF523A0|nr:alkaline phosphatase D family protein [Pseudoalteromonas sp. OOF1S-7]MCG7535397.1 alkaline phosphatase D family protein [Pseudoalteromonas sp. OOF1S-7]
MKILSGPMLRRLESNCAYIWLVIQEEFDDAFQGKFDVALLSAQTWLGREQLSGDSECIDIKLAESLHAVMVCLKAPASGWPEAKSVGYDLCYGQQSLFQPVYFYGPLPLYHDEAYPSFRYYPESTKIMSASCRKPHGAKQDALAAYDRKIEQSGSLNKLPDVLFLTGDQIYADDVEPQVAKLIYQYASELFPDEALAGNPYSGHSLDSIGWRNRHSLLNEYSGFYTSEGEYHLLGFREYLTMYLLAWGGLYHDLPKPERPLLTWFNGKKQLKKYRAMWRSYYKARNFLAQSWRIRRLLAHVPTYMMFDDHEVTDDWNLSAEIQTLLSKRGSLGQQVVTNALAAFTLCQAWGNAPEQYTKFIKCVLPNFIGGLTVYNARQYQDTFDKLNGQNFTTLSATNPPAILLDTRTQRGFRPGKTFTPLLMNNKALRQMRALLATLEPTPRELIVVSPAPVYGFRKVEKFQLSIPRALKCWGATRADAECWISDTEQMNKFRRTLLELPELHNCYILSGDVHYGYCRREQLVHPLNAHNVEFWQLTSSSVSNVPKGNLAILLNCLHYITLRYRPFIRKNSHYLLPSNVQGRFLTGHLNLGLLELGPLDDSGEQTRNYVLSVLQPNGKWHDWHYDLQNPTLLTQAPVRD